MRSDRFPRLAGKVVLITGAWGGLGRTFARHLLASGARLILSDLAERPLPELADDGALPAGWERGVLGQVAADLNVPDGPRQLFEACRGIAPVDVVIHNAGTAFIGHYQDIPVDKMHLQMRVLLTAPMELTHLFLPGFLARGHGHFVFVDSVAGFVATPLGTTYSAAKFGLRGFAMALAGELRKRAVDVTIVYPFFTRTAILKSPKLGDAKVPVMPRILIDDPDRVIRTALRAVDRRRLHVWPGFYSKVLWQAVRFWPVVSSQMQPRSV
ncbi:MAG: SDR family NAD(P)-dependent oxidoreductase [Deltaproteobacteria bacterium]|nr:SDR family NAD(P)-dependent oxidoreductase [Deltaproteobacteria bacterium]